MPKLLLMFISLYRADHLESNGSEENYWSLKMCWNKKVSLVTFIVVIILAVILFRRNRGSDRHLAVFSAVFVTIQLLEFFVWLSLEKGRSGGAHKAAKMNDLMTRLILIALWAQPLINSYMAYRDRSSNSRNPSSETDNNPRTDSSTSIDDDPLFNKAVKSLMLILIVIFLVLFLVAIKNASEPGSKFKTYPGENCHLVWSRRTANGKSRPIGHGFMGNHAYQSVLYLIGLSLPILLIRPLKKGLVLAVLGAVLLIISRRMSSREEFGSWWCWIAGIFVVAALILKDPKRPVDSRTDQMESQQFS